MKSLSAIFFLLVSAFFLSACKKKPDSVSIKVYNPFYDEGIAGAEVALIETKENAITKNFECQVVKIITMDAQGEAVISHTKLKRNDKYSYAIRVRKAYNSKVSNADFCGFHPGDQELPKTNDALHLQLNFVPPAQTGWTIKLTNLKDGGFGSYLTDSMSVRVFQDFGFAESWDDPFGGSKFNGSKREVGSFNINKSFVSSATTTLSYPDLQFFPTPFGKHKVVVYKRKSGVVTTNTYTEVILHTEFIHEFVVAW